MKAENRHPKGVMDITPLPMWPALSLESKPFVPAKKIDTIPVAGQSVKKVFYMPEEELKEEERSVFD